MRLLSSYLELRLYRNKEFLLDAKNPSKPKLQGKLTVISPERKDLYSVLNHSMINTRYYKSFFTDKLVRMKLVNGVMITRKQRVTDIHKEVREHLPFIQFTFLNADQYADRNVIFDMSSRLSALDETRFASVNTFVKQAYASLDSMHKDGRYTDYKKYYILPIDDSVKIDQKYIVKQNIKSVVQAMIYRILVEPETLIDWVGSTLIFVNNAGMFTYVHITQEIIEKGIDTRFFRFMKALYAFAAADVEAMSECEGEFETESEEESKSKEDPTDAKIERIIKRISPNGSGASNALKDAVASKLIKGHSDPDDPAFDDALDFAEVDEDEIEDIVKKLGTAISPQGKQAGTNSVKTDDPDDVIDTDDLDELDDVVDVDAIDNAETEELYKEVAEVVRHSQVSQRTEKELQKIKLLQSNFGEVKFSDNERSFKELLVDFERTQIDAPELPANVRNKSIKRATGQAVNKAYYEKQLDADIVQVMKYFAEDADIKVVVIDAKKEDISDPLNSIMRYTFKLKDEFDKVHTINYEIPKLIDNKFFLLNGTKKVMNNQIVSIPVVKLSSDEVHIVTNYNQGYITRFGKSLDPKIELVKKFLKKLPNGSAYGISQKLGNSFEVNAAYSTVMEYDDISQNIYSITIESKDKSNTVSFIFNQHDIRVMIENLGIAYVEKPELMPIAISNNKEIIYININTGKDSKKNEFTVCDLILSAIRQFADISDINAILNKITVPKKYTYSRIFYLDRKLALGVFLGFLFGLEELLKRMGVKYELTDEKKQVDGDRYNQNFIKFADKYLYYDINPIRHSLILNGIGTEMNTESYNFDQMNSIDPYLDTFDELFKTRHMAKGFNDCRTFLMDPISKQVMQTLGLPTEFLDVMLYANSLLEDNSKTDPKKMQINRIRKYELIPVFMYKSMTQAYLQYKYRYAGAKKGMISVRPNEIITKLNESRLCNDYDTLNPIREVESEGTLTFKGPGGCNVDDAYTLSRRAYDKSMVGVIAVSSPDSGSVGITKYMSMNPRITDTRGFVKTGEDADAKDIDFGNMGSIAELTTPFAIDHDDPKRLGFVTKESKHVIPAMHTDPLLIGNGVEKVFPFMVSNDFITIAKESGTVNFVDKKLGIAIVEYKSGVRETIDIKNRQHKNGGGGFFILNEKDFPYKAGESFKKNDVLCKNPSYFSNVKGKNAPEYNPGTLSNVAIVMSHVTFEDSSVITERIAEKMSAEIVFCKQVTLGAKSKVYDMVNVGSTVATGDPLMIFEDELTDPEINRIINATDTSNLEGLTDIIRHIPKSKISGTIHDIKIYYTVPYEDMSDSVRKIVEEYDGTIKARRKKITEYGALNPNEVITDNIGITRPNSSGKINGSQCPVGKILVEIYEKYRDYPGSGDKIVFYASMKTVIHRQLPQEMAPYPLGHPERPIDALLSPISVNARQVTSIIYALYGNKLIYGLKEKVRKIYDAYQKGEMVSKKVSGESGTRSLIDDILEGTLDPACTLENTLEKLGYDREEIVSVVGEDAKVNLDPLSKNIYVCLYSPKTGGFSKQIQHLTNSKFSHVSWTIDSSGSNFKSMNNGLITENLNSLEGIKDKMTSYHVYKIPVTDSEYTKAVEMFTEHESGNFKYDFKSIFRLAAHILISGDYHMDGFKESDLAKRFQICSSYVLSSLAIIKPSILRWLKKKDLNVSTVTPTQIREVPGIQFMFQGNAMFEFERWVRTYEKTHGKLPN